MTICLDLFGVCRNVAPYDIGPIRLKVPWRYQHEVVVPYPHPSLYLSSNTAGPHLAVCALYNDVVAADQFYDPSKKLTLARHHHLFKSRFVQYFSFP